MRANREHNGLWFLGGLLLGAAGGFALARRRVKRRSMPYLEAWRRALRESSGEIAAQALCERVQARYFALLAESPQLEVRALREHLTQHILPGLALYQVLKEDMADEQAAVAEVGRLFEEARRFQVGDSAAPPWMAILARFNNPLAVLRRLIRPILRSDFPEEGWAIDFVADDDTCLAFNISRCFYLDMLTRYGAPELTPCFCAMDDLTWDNSPPGMTWERSTTLALGGEVCDFRWCSNLDASPRVQALYKDVPPDSLEAFQSFKAAHQPRRVIVDGVTWRYLVLGEGEETLLLLPGALGVPDISWQILARFAEHYRVIAPSYAALDTMDALADGLAGILAHEHIDRAHVLGGSYGGLVAQVFVRRYPQLTRLLMLSHTLPPDPQTGIALGKILRWLRVVPAALLVRLTKMRLGALLPEKTPQTALSHAIFEDVLLYRLSKAALLSSVERTLDYSALEFKASDLKDWPGRVLLLLSDDDPSTPDTVRSALQALYPEAHLHLFQGSGHAASLLQEDAYVTAVRDFINAQEGEG